MGAAATLIARILDRYRWLAWVGLIVILFVAIRMIWEGGWEIGEASSRDRSARSPAAARPEAGR